MKKKLSTIMMLLASLLPMNAQNLQRVIMVISIVT